MNGLPPGFDRLADEIIQTAASAEGHLSGKEGRLLVLLAAVPTASGEVLEIGSFKGKSTIILAQAAALAGQMRVVAVDPLTSPSVTDPSLRGKDSGWEDFQANLKRAGVEQQVEFHQQFSYELAAHWPGDRKIRLLWIDGDHTYKGAKLDFDLFAPRLADGAIVAMHDVLHHAGPARVFAEDILLSRNFAAAGFCGSIGWAQHTHEPVVSPRLLNSKQDVYRRLSRFIACMAFGQKPKGLAKIRGKLARARLPHGEINAASWIQEVRRPGHEPAG